MIAGVKHARAGHPLHGGASPARAAQAEGHDPGAGALDAGAPVGREVEIKVDLIPSRAAHGPQHAEAGAGIRGARQRLGCAPDVGFADDADA
eukprot:7470422-Pyramimonas_sp.AAC.1